MAKQLYIFGPSLNTGPRIKAAMREAIRKSSMSRQVIAEKMKHAAEVDGLGGGRGSTISLANLDAWCSETHSNLIPVNLLTIFCKVTGCMDPLRVMANPLGGTFIDEGDAKLLACAKLDIQMKELATKKKKILSEIKGEWNGKQQI